MEMSKDLYLQDLEKAAKVVCNGGIILYPTDTIWGIGCDATNTKAIERIFRLKKRADAKAMISLVGSLNSLRKHVETVPLRALDEMKKTQSPLTIIYDQPKGLNDKLKATDGSAAFRIPALEFTRELCMRIDAPLVSTSANTSDKPSPSCFNEIEDDIMKGVDYICMYGRELSEPKTPSRIVKISNDNKMTVIRE